MRAPVLVLVILILLICVGILLLHPRPHQETVADEGGGQVPANSPAMTADTRPSNPAPAMEAMPVTNAVAPTATVAANDPINPSPEQLNATLAQLDNLAQSGAPDASSQTVNYLNSTNQSIRLAAVEALKQIGDRWVTNNLLEKAAATEDPYERVAYQKAIDFLKLPTFREQMANQDGAAPQ